MLVFWLFAIFGLLDIDLFPSETEFDSDIPGFVGLLHTLGLTGVPITLVISIIALIGFSICYFVSAYILTPLGSPLLQYTMGTVVLLIAFLLAIPVTAKLIKPMKPLFVKHYAPSNKDYIGFPCTVSSSTVSESFGVGIVETGGSPLQIHIRADSSKQFKKGMTLIIADYNDADDFFEVISQEEYEQLVNK
jgi:hypothetical protein